MQYTKLFFTGLFLSLSSFACHLHARVSQTGSESDADNNPPGSRPNILFIVSEDNGPELGCYGAQVSTPNLDKLADQGTLFRHAYVPQPGCSPSRASFFTGLYPHQNGQIALATWGYSMYNPHTPNFVNDLKDSGYRTGNIGKIHVNPESAFNFDFWQIHGGNRKRKKLERYNDYAKQFIQASDKPFYLQVNYPEAHVPFLTQVNGMPEEYLDGDEVEVLPFFGVSSEKMKQQVADYYNCIMRLDEMVGELLEILKASGEYENTMIVYIGDHGIDMLRGKRTCYEGGVRVPLIISWPRGGKQGVDSRELVTTLDLYPTFMELTGNEIPGHLPGKSLLPIIKGKSGSMREYLFTEYHTHSNHNPFPQRTVRNDRYKLIHNLVAGHENPGYHYTIGKKVDEDDFYCALTKAPEKVVDSYKRLKRPPEYELYDLKQDPYEWVNLANDPKYSKVLIKLKKALREWQQQTKDPMTDREVAERFFRQVMQSRESRKPLPYHEYLDPGYDFE